MRSRRSSAPRRAALLLLLAAGCVPAAHSPGRPAPAVLDEAAVREVATLIRLEDRREFDGDALRRAAASSAPEVRRRAAYAVGRLRSAEGLPILAALLADPDTAVAATAAFSVGQLGDTAGVGLLLPLVGAPARERATVAAEAAAGLGKLRSPAAAAALRSLLADTPLPPGRDPVVEEALLAIWRHPREADVEHILRWTEARDPALRWRAAYALVRRPAPRATPRLLALAADPDAEVRALAVRGLTRPLADSAGVPPSAALPVLLAAAGDADARVAVNAIRSLGTFAVPEAVERLRTLLAAEPGRAVAAAEALGRLGPEAGSAAPALDAAARDTALPIGVRSAALTALVRVDAARAETASAVVAQEGSWRARAAAARAIAALPAPRRAAAASMVRDPDPRVGAAALGALVESAGDSVAPLRELVIEALGAADVQLRTAALVGLVRLRDPATLPLALDAFERAQRDTLDDAALAALDVLGALRESGVPAAAALTARFRRPADYLIRQRAVERLGDAVVSAWGTPLPIDTGRDLDDYESLVRRWIVPALAGAPLPRVRVVTASGEFDLRLFAADAPLTVESFLALAERGYFDGQEWPRVVPNFVIQGGDPRGDQTGGPGYAIRDELNRHRYLRGTLGMALSGPDTGGSQFFVTHSPQPHLDGGYTVFGEVVAGMETVDRVVAGERIGSIRVIR